jgi:hypothetical protein
MEMDSSGNSATAKKIHIKDVCSHVMHVTELREWRKNGTVTYKPRRMPRHQRVQAHNSTPYRRQHSFT